MCAFCGKIDENFLCEKCNKKFEKLTFYNRHPMITCNAYPAELKVFLNHVYEYKKGVRNMVLYTTNKKYEEFAVSRLNSQNIDYCIQPIGCNKINLFFGRRECIEVIQSMTSRPLNELTPEEDFILGAMLGYDICGQCLRYCKRKAKWNNYKIPQKPDLIRGERKIQNIGVCF